jgi:lipopolysaccharide/colanic/teichoic acid biosynthesis glycosyltransferase
MYVRVVGPYARLKRLVDVAAVVAVAPIVLPIGLLVAGAVRFGSPGSVMFSQLRTGHHGRRFRMYKFRTMVANAEELKSELGHLNELDWPDFKITDDPRVTRIGKVLRSTSLDELPQLYNVLRGDMSLVGPRPTSFSANTYDLWHTVRLEVRPGLTGIWQVTARNGTEFDERLRLDAEYVRNMSLALDLRIMIMTVASVVRRSGV